MRITSSLLPTALGTVLTVLGCAGTEPPGQRTFATADSAAVALAAAVIANDTVALLAIMGPDSRPLILPTDEVQAAHDRHVVATALEERWWLEDGEDGSKVLVLGNESWPFPIPIVKDKDGWRFNTAAGQEELLFRRVGQNELAVMDVAEAYVAAQDEYASKSRDGKPVGTYAQRFVSDDGRHNGLYWPVSNADPTPSPMGQLAAQAASDGYRRPGASRYPYHGYYFKVLTAQGTNAPGGAKSYLVDSLMRGGFAMIAWPADYGESGVMTFTLGKDGVLRQKDLGPDTDKLASAIEVYDPDSSWNTP